jgi:hypothetical protein
MIWQFIQFAAAGLGLMSTLSLLHELGHLTFHHPPGTAITIGLPERHSIKLHTLRGITLRLAPILVRASIVFPGAGAIPISFMLAGPATTLIMLTILTCLDCLIVPHGLPINAIAHKIRVGAATGAEFWHLTLTSVLVGAWCDLAMTICPAIPGSDGWHITYWRRGMFEELTMAQERKMAAQKAKDGEER